MYCVYLRKSRADADAERHGEGETLARHESALISLAEKMNLTIGKIYREVVSGETISARPVMQQLLHEVEQGIWRGVLVMEVERLARGDTIDQGLVAQAFKYSGTKIITPLKIYDPFDEFDEEYFEFGLFMSRREYKIINRRLQNGRLASVKEGKYAGSISPYGYERQRIPDGKGWMLIPVEAEADIIKLIYKLYTEGENGKRIGTTLIAKRLNAMSIPSKNGGAWSASTIRDILINPVYMGKLRWKWRRAVKTATNGRLNITRPRSCEGEYIITNGLHTPIISNEIFLRAQELISINPPCPVQEHGVIKNPLAGLIVCGKCGHKMVRRPHKNQQASLICTHGCGNISSPLSIVENRVISCIDMFLSGYKLNLKSENTAKSTEISSAKNSIKQLTSRLRELNKQLDGTYELLERGVYSIEIFNKRSEQVRKKIELTENTLQTAEISLNALSQHNGSAPNIPLNPYLDEAYRMLPDSASKNTALKEILEKIVYIKEQTPSQKPCFDSFRLTLYPKIPPMKKTDDI